jgi:hypothetical protein
MVVIMFPEPDHWTVQLLQRQLEIKTTMMKSALLCLAIFAIASAAPTLRSRPEGWNVVSEIAVRFVVSSRIFVFEFSKHCN